MKYSLISLFLMLFIISCDEGRIYESTIQSPTEDGNIEIEAEILNAASWPSSYTVSIAAFEAESDYAVVAKSIGAPLGESSKYIMTLSNIPPAASSVEICVVNRLRQRIASFYSINILDVEEKVVVDKTLDVNMFKVIQDNVFTTTCANCHGASSFAAANLYLTEGKSFENLVDKESQVLGEGIYRVKRGSKENSLLYEILTGDTSSEWNYDHSSEITDYNTLELIGAWIDNGANN